MIQGGIILYRGKCFGETRSAWNAMLTDPGLGAGSTNKKWRHSALLANQVTGQRGHKATGQRCSFYFARPGVPAEKSAGAL